MRRSPPACASRRRRSGRCADRDADDERGERAVARPRRDARQGEQQQEDRAPGRSRSPATTASAHDAANRPQPVDVGRSRVPTRARAAASRGAPSATAAPRRSRRAKRSRSSAEPAPSGGLDRSRQGAAGASRRPGGGAAVARAARRRPAAGRPRGARRVARRRPPGASAARRRCRRRWSVRPSPRPAAQAPDSRLRRASAGRSRLLGPAPSPAGIVHRRAWRPAATRRARAGTRGRACAGRRTPCGLIVQYVPLDAPYHGAAVQPGSNGSSSAAS